jgi:hypothetical protein
MATSIATSPVETKGYVKTDAEIDADLEAQDVEHVQKAIDALIAAHKMGKSTKILFSSVEWSSHEPDIGCHGITQIYIVSWANKGKTRIREHDVQIEDLSHEEYEVREPTIYSSFNDAVGETAHDNHLDMWEEGTTDREFLKWIADRRKEKKKNVEILD